MSSIRLRVDNSQAARLRVKNDAVNLDVGGSFYAIGTPYYEGDYTVTPSTETQVLPIAEFRASQNITVNPIPSNYGLITWNGSVLTVS